MGYLDFHISQSFTTTPSRNGDSGGIQLIAALCTIGYSYLPGKSLDNQLGAIMASIAAVFARVYLVFAAHLVQHHILVAGGCTVVAGCSLVAVEVL